jgi:D-glycero-D-manno-heptose 1,7-bisphosphate phosphatase
MKKAVFLDRDGVINRKAAEGQYVTSWKEMEFLPGVANAIILLRRARFCVIVVSNQRCVAKGLMTLRDLNALNHRMCGELAASGAIVDGVYYCPHDKQPSCNCRKPAPGMLLTAAREHHINLAASWMIGDSDSDVEAGKSAGCKTARLLQHREVASGNADLFAQSLLDATQKILLLVGTARRLGRRPFSGDNRLAHVSSRDGSRK